MANLRYTFGKLCLFLLHNCRYKVGHFKAFFHEAPVSQKRSKLSHQSKYIYLHFAFCHNFSTRVGNSWRTTNHAYLSDIIPNTSAFFPQTTHSVSPNTKTRNGTNYTWKRNFYEYWSGLIGQESASALLRVGRVRLKPIVE